ncbi:NDP-sugar synthase [candidate division WS5 bacterium]|uniref:NDP-sugar synthase n=1 Tax=candidate division WS5 bacterium TaxID=2093353 RepID=A0A419DGU0_9BACT|nr:MAG: NDP-sugar synthase [candidate division WS5 bacterium]
MGLGFYFGKGLCYNVGLTKGKAMKAIILAGGYATRLWPLTKERAKPLLLINGKPIVTHLVEKLPKNMEIFLVTNLKFKQSFRDWQKNLGRDVNLVFDDARKEAEKPGALGAIANTIHDKGIDEDVLVLGGDNYFQFSFKEFIKEYSGAPLICAYDIGDKQDASKFGVLTAKGKRVVSFEEKPKNPKSTLVNTLCMAIPKNSFPLLFQFVKDYSDNTGEFVKYLIKKDKVNVHITKKDWFDIGSFQGYLQAHLSVARERGEEENFYGVDFVGKNTLEGKVFIDKGTVIKNSYLKDCIILEDCKIVDSHITNCIIDRSVSINGCKRKDEILEEKSIVCKGDKCKVPIK